MIKVYIEDWKISKTINQGFFDSEPKPENSIEIDSEYDISDHLVFEDWVLKLYQDSAEYSARKSELESKDELDEYEQKELEYINSL